MRVEKISAYTENSAEVVSLKTSELPLLFAKNNKNNVKVQLIKTNLYQKYGQEFIEILTDSEGLKHFLYNDLGGNKTIGFGHNASLKGDVEQYEGRYLTEEEAYELLAKDLKNTEKFVIQELGEDAYNSLTKKQKGAILDIAFNTDFRKSPKLIQALKEGKWLDAMKEMNQIKGDVKSFNFSELKFETEKVVISGLALRRIKDISLFLQDVDLTKYSNKEIQDFKNSIQNIYNKGLESTRFYRKYSYKSTAKQYLSWLE